MEPKGAGPAEKTGNAKAVTGFVLAFFPILSLAGLALSIMGLRQANRTNSGKEGLAIAGIVISVLSIIATVALVVLIVFIVNLYNQAKDRNEARRVDAEAILEAAYYYGDPIPTEWSQIADNVTLQHYSLSQITSGPFLSPQEEVAMEQKDAEAIDLFDNLSDKLYIFTNAECDTPAPQAWRPASEGVKDGSGIAIVYNLEATEIDPSTDQVSDQRRCLDYNFWPTPEAIPIPEAVEVI